MISKIVWSTQLETLPLIRTYVRAPDFWDTKSSHKQTLCASNHRSSSQILSEFFNKDVELHTNTCHFQCVDDVGSDLIVEARALDGTIEAISVPESKNFALGVQWHPEFNHDKDRLSTVIFGAFTDACRGK